MKFKLRSTYQPRGDQPTAIDQLVRGIEAGDKHQVLLGVTGSGKTFTMAKVIEALDRPALVLAHNKTLAAQLYHEFKSFFPENAVEYFVSYYDYYQPEAYVPSADLYIDKESTINDELDKLRMSATRALFERRDVIIVSSVSCIYGLGSPEAYYGMLVMLEKGQETSREAMLRRFVDIQYERSEDLAPRHLPRARRHDRNLPALRRQRLPHRDVGPADRRHPPDRSAHRRSPHRPGRFARACSIYPKTHYVMPAEQRERAIQAIYAELEWWKKELERQGKFVEAQRVTQRTHVRHRNDAHRRLLPRRGELFAPPERPPARAKRRQRLLDYVPQDYLLFIDESHQTVPQMHGMHGGDRSRKADAGGLRFPHALGAGQSPADVRRVRAPHQPGALRFRHSGPVRADQIRRSVSSSK